MVRERDRRVMQEEATVEKKKAKIQLEQTPSDSNHLLHHNTRICVHVDGGFSQLKGFLDNNEALCPQRI